MSKVNKDGKDGNKDGKKDGKKDSNKKASLKDKKASLELTQKGKLATLIKDKLPPYLAELTNGTMFKSSRVVAGQMVVPRTFENDDSDEEIVIRGSSLDDFVDSLIAGKLDTMDDAAATTTDFRATMDDAAEWAATAAATAAATHGASAGNRGSTRGSTRSNPGGKKNSNAGEKRSKSKKRSTAKGHIMGAGVGILR